MNVVIDTAGQTYIVTDAGEGLEHLWFGVPAKKTRAGHVAKKNQQPRLISKSECKPTA